MSGSRDGMMGLDGFRERPEEAVQFGDGGFGVCVVDRTDAQRPQPPAGRPPRAVKDGLLSAPYPSATATFDGGTLAYLTRRRSPHTAPDGATLWEFGAIAHGDHRDELLARVIEEIRVWDRERRGQDVRFEAHPVDAELAEEGPGWFVFDNKLNQIVIEWH
ncbi:hypothetical protein ACFQLX_16090 [Streptomyces polyrhachis]|uniref:Uncharacterized protein n=1 Tax=Streptomyces polyrhachis TaxID=1282885 RepID=A0ABW2GI74_9ACTN